MVLVTVIKHNYNKKTSTTKSHLGTAEKKLLIIFCYFTLLVSMAFVAFALNAKSLNSIGRRFGCLSSGSSTSGNCDNQMNANVSQIFYLLVIVLLAFLPAVSLIYVVKCGELKHCCTLCIKHRKVQPSTGHGIKH